MANSSAGTIIGDAWNILRTQGSSTDLPALREDAMLRWLTWANREWLKAHRRGGGSGPMAFLRETGFDLVSDTALNEASGILSTDTEFTVDSSDDFDTSNGALVIWDEEVPDVVFYTTNTVASETFSGVTQIAFSHEDNDIVQKLYKLPTNFMTFRPSDDYGDGVQLNGTPLYFREGTPEPGFFTTREDGTNTFLWLPRGSSGTAAVLYEKLTDAIDSSDDTVDVEPDNEHFLVWRIVQLASVPKYGASPSDLYVLAKSEANKALQEALNDRNVGRRIRPRPIRRLGAGYHDPSLYVQR